MKPTLITLTGLTAVAAQAAINFNLNFENINAAGVVWNETQISVITQAANEWGSLFVNDYTIDVDLTFTRKGTSSYLGQWQGRAAPGTVMGDDVKPWENSAHVISFNADLMDASLSHYLWWDEDTSTQSVASNHWDALTVARHEFGHLLGFSAGFYADDIFTDNHNAPWENLIDESHVFDPGGLNVQLEPDHAHTAPGIGYSQDLMLASLTNGTRRGISDIHLSMLELAYGYEFASTPVIATFAQNSIPEPGHLSFIGAFLVTALGLLRRRQASR